MLCGFDPSPGVSEFSSVPSPVLWCERPGMPLMFVFSYSILLYPFTLLLLVLIHYAKDHRTRILSRQVEGPEALIKSLLRPHLMPHKTPEQLSPKQSTKVSAFVWIHDLTQPSPASLLPQKRRDEKSEIKCSAGESYILWVFLDVYCYCLTVLESFNLLLQLIKWLMCFTSSKDKWMYNSTHVVCYVYLHCINLVGSSTWTF